MTENKEFSLSIGQIGEPYCDEVNDRIKGLLPVVITPENIDVANNYIDKSRQLCEQHSVTRNSLRMIISNEVKIPKMSEEGRMPLNRKWGNYEILYLAENKPERFSSQEILQKEEELVTNLLDSRVSTKPRQIEDDGYFIEILESPDDNDLKQIQELLQEVFTRYIIPFTWDNVKNLITNPGSVTSVVRTSQREIVSMTVAERMTVETDMGDLYICELSEESTHPDHRRRGLLQACMTSLMSHLYDNGIDLIFEEARASHIGVNKAAVKLGFEYGGTLNKHCIIGGTSEIPEKGVYENLNIWYHPGPVS